MRRAKFLLIILSAVLCVDAKASSRKAMRQKAPNNGDDDDQVTDPSDAACFRALVKGYQKAHYMLR